MSFEQEFATEIEKAGGRVFYVGGYVRDTLMGKPCNDKDVEVYGIQKEHIKKIASPNFNSVEATPLYGAVLLH